MNTNANATHYTTTSTTTTGGVGMFAPVANHACPSTCAFFLTDFERCMKNTTRREHIKKHVEKHTVYPATHNRKCKLLYNTYAKCFNGGDGVVSSSTT